MNRMVLVTLAPMLVCAHANGASLYDLINKNVQDAASAYDMAPPSPRQSASVGQLWIHVRSESQKKVAKEILDRVARAKFGEWKVERKPVQEVDYGPRRSQLRYFKKQDRPQAQKLFNMLRKLVPELELNDSSGKYENVVWIRPGHYELWLSPHIMRLEKPGG